MEFRNCTKCNEPFHFLGTGEQCFDCRDEKDSNCLNVTNTGEIISCDNSLIPQFLGQECVVESPDCSELKSDNYTLCSICDEYFALHEVTELCSDCQENIIQDCRDCHYNASVVGHAYTCNDCFLNKVLHKDGQECI